MNKTENKPMTKEDREKQVLRFLADKKENLFNLILANLIRAGMTSVGSAVDLAIEGADYAIKKLYQIPDAK